MTPSKLKPVIKGGGFGNRTHFSRFMDNNSPLQNEIIAGVIPPTKSDSQESKRKKKKKL